MVIPTKNVHFYGQQFTSAFKPKLDEKSTSILCYLHDNSLTYCFADVLLDKRTAQKWAE